MWRAGRPVFRKCRQQLCFLKTVLTEKEKEKLLKLIGKGKQFIEKIKGKLPEKLSLKGAGLLALLVVCTTAIVAGIAKTYAADVWTITFDSSVPGGVTEVFKEIKMFPQRSAGDPNIGLVAPGFGNNYRFRVKNANSFGVKCTTEVFVEFTNPTAIPDADFPLQATFTDIADSKVSVLTLDKKSDVRALAKNGGSKEYSFNWSWDFESGNDELDTAWGNATDDVVIKVTIKVTAEQTDFAVIFDSKGGTECPSRVVSYGDPLGTLPSPTKADYTFAGWFTEDGTLVTDETVLSPDGGAVTLTARWKIIPGLNDYDDYPHRYDRPQKEAQITYGNWNLINDSEHVWTYTANNGTKLENGWYDVYNPYTSSGRNTQWFRFDEEGYLMYGWIKESDRDWYYTHGSSDGDLGALEYGWHNDEQDGRTYYLDEETGLMKSGWQWINGFRYYFTTFEEVPNATWNYQGVRREGLANWFYEAIGARPYGSMYRSEMTPDGCEVDEFGRWCINGVPQTDASTLNRMKEPGWIKVGERDWYHASFLTEDKLPIYDKGWYTDDQDKRTYYLDPVSGLMWSGWHVIGDYWYYFTTYEEVPYSTWGTDSDYTSGYPYWQYVETGMRPYGSMYRGEMTPDGYEVDEFGRWCINGVPQKAGMTPLALEKNRRKEPGWIRVGERDWYHASYLTEDKLPVYDKGWYTDDQDGRTYYLDPVSGLMWSGWHVIGGYWYYFTTYEEVPYSTWGTEVEYISGYPYWEYVETDRRSYGSMYVNEVTPDGYTVDEYGRYCENGVLVRVY